MNHASGAPSASCCGHRNMRSAAALNSTIFWSSSIVMTASIAESRMPRSRASLCASRRSARVRVVMSRRITVSTLRPASTCWEIDASIGNSSPLARSATSDVAPPMRRDVTPVAANAPTCA